MFCCRTHNRNNDGPFSRRRYQILSDPAKRKYYDRKWKEEKRRGKKEDESATLFGAENNRGVDPMQHMSAEAVMATMTAQLESLSPGQICCCFLAPIGCFLITGIILPVLFLGLRIDGATKWNWAVVFIPMWIVDVFACVGLVATWVSMGSSSTFGRTDMTIKTIQFICILLFQIFLVLRLNGDVKWRVVLVFIPWILYEVIGVISTIRGGKDHYVAFRPNGDAMNNLDHERSDFALFLLWSCSGHVSRLALAILVALKIDGTIGEWNWFLVFLPIWINAVAQVALTKWRLNVLARSKGDEDDHDASRQDQAATALTHSSVYQDVFGNVTYLLVAVLLCAKLASHSGSDFSIFLVILPWIIPLFCLCCCGCCAVHGILTSGSFDGPSQDSSYGGMPDNADNDASASSTTGTTPGV